MKRPKRSGAADRSAHLLDTRALVWALAEPERLPVKVRRLVEAGENVVSVASYWEVVIKAQKGLLSISDLATWWRQATELTSARILHIRPAHITTLAALPMLHKTPSTASSSLKRRPKVSAWSRTTARLAVIRFRRSGSRPQGLQPPTDRGAGLKTRNYERHRPVQDRRLRTQPVFGHRDSKRALAQRDE
jgi:PIN domain nuclease of toxin-antitoxin system